MGLEKKLTVCYFGTYRSEYSRNKIMIKGLLKNDVEVIECHETLWKSIEDRVKAVKYGFVNPKLWARFIKTYFRLIKKFRNLPKYDVIIIGYPGHFDVFLAKILTLFKKTPIVWDVFMSIYLISIERNLQKKNPISVYFLKILEYLALRIPDKLIIDTEQYANWFNKTYGIALNKFGIVPTGADDDVFLLEDIPKYIPKKTMKILYYGTYIPNHGVPYIIEAANLLKNDLSITFQFIGDGPEFNFCKHKIEDYGLSNIEIYPWMEQEELKKYIREADVVLGAFGKTPQSLMTIQNKIYESMAMGKLVVTGESDAVKAVFENFQEIIYCDRNNPEALFELLLKIKDSRKLIERASRNAYFCFQNNFSISKNGKKFEKIISNTLNF